MISPLRQICIVMIALALLSFLPRQALAGSENIIRTMKLSELDQMIQKKEQRCVVSFMAAWCAPCIQELPVLSSLCDKYSGRGLNLTGISLDFGGPSAMQPVVNRLKLKFPIYWVGEKAISSYEIKSIPLLLMVRDGRIIRRISGKQSEKLLDQEIRKFLELEQE